MGEREQKGKTRKAEERDEKISEEKLERAAPESWHNIIFSTLFFSKRIPSQSSLSLKMGTTLQLSPFESEYHSLQTLFVPWCFRVEFTLSTINEICRNTWTFTLNTRENWCSNSTKGLQPKSQ